MTIHKDTMVLQSEEINQITSKLERGDIKRLAVYVGKHEKTISYYFKYRKDVNGWAIKRTVYYKMLEFIQTL